MRYKEISALALTVILPLAALFTYIFFPTLNRVPLFGMWNFFVNVPSLILFLSLIILYSALYARLYHFNFKKALLLLGVIFPLIFWLIELKLSLNKNNPYASARFNFYNLYTQFYLLGFIFSFGFFGGEIYRLLFKEKNKDIFTGHISSRAFYLNFFVLGVYFCTQFVACGDLLGLSAIAAGFLIPQVLALQKISLANVKTIFAGNRVLTNNKFWYLVIFITAFIIRYFWGVRVIALTGDSFLKASDDGLAYGALAALLAKGKTLSPGNALYWGGVGYWYFLSFIYRVFGESNFKAVIFIQALLGACVPVTIVYIAKNLFNRSVGIMSAAFCVFSTNLIFLSGVIGMEALFIPLMFIALAMVLKLLREEKYQKPTYLLAYGIFLGITYSTRQEIIFFPLVLLISMLFSLRNKFTLGKIINTVSLITLGMFIVLLFIANSNYIKYDRFTFMTGQSATTFSMSCGSIESTILNKMGFNPFENSAGALHVFLEKPASITGLFLKSYFKKGAHYLFVANFGTFDPILVVNPRYYLSRYPVYLAVFAVFFLFLGFILAWRNKKRGDRFPIVLFLVYSFYTFSVYAVIQSLNPRHRGILEPIFLMFVAYGVSRSIVYLRGRKA